MILVELLCLCNITYTHKLTIRNFIFNLYNNMSTYQFLVCAEEHCYDNLIVLRNGFTVIWLRHFLELLMKIAIYRPYTISWLFLGELLNCNRRILMMGVPDPVADLWRCYSLEYDIESGSRAIIEVIYAYDVIYWYFSKIRQLRRNYLQLGKICECLHI